MSESVPHHKHPWKARLLVTLIMLIMAFAGLVVSDVKKDGAWTYWRVMVPCFALLCLWLSWYLRRTAKHVLTPITIWHEMLHWLGLILTVYLISTFVNMGVMGKKKAVIRSRILSWHFPPTWHLTDYYFIQGILFRQNIKMELLLLFMAPGTVHLYRKKDFMWLLFHL